jgi:hypothetical protein
MHSNVRILGCVWVQFRDVRIARRFAREGSIALVAEVFHLQVHLLDMSNNTLPFHGGSSAVAPCARHD